MAWLKALGPEDEDALRRRSLLEALTGIVGGDALLRDCDLLMRPGVFDEEEVRGPHCHRLRVEFLPEGRRRGHPGP